ncbi:MAG: hypothetical protein EZS28_019242 [Streblomastix strix]|uniref:Uncharacterized protein n=1 Tax=Streblomastix strix TaxID=222440 RepID=A0A5J4VRN9_9EUKA|nr:MAG: hypothetical protein EZS28_019242 [Streblomastix strix]
MNQKVMGIQKKKAFLVLVNQIVKEKLQRSNEFEFIAEEQSSFDKDFVLYPTEEVGQDEDDESYEEIM